MSTSETPRTDNFYVNDLEKPSYEDAQSIEFARQLEKELTTAKASRDAWKKMAGQLNRALDGTLSLAKELSDALKDRIVKRRDVDLKLSSAIAANAAYEKLLKEDGG